MSRLESFEALVKSSEETEYKKYGFHFKHLIEKEQLLNLANFFFEEGYYLEMMTCQDRLAETQTMRLCYTFNLFGESAIDKAERHMVQLEVNPDSEEPSTLSSIFAASDWFEREVYDMYGVRFKNHPNMKRILLPEDVDFFALRKDFGRMEDAEETPDV